jgi:dTMP kinase
VELALARTAGRGSEDRFERERGEFFERVRRCYLALAAREPDRFRVVDASGPLEAVRAQLAQVLDEFVTASLG